MKKLTTEDVIYKALDLVEFDISNENIRKFLTVLRDNGKWDVSQADIDRIYKMLTNNRKEQ